MQETFAKKAFVSIARTVVVPMELIQEETVRASGSVMAACGHVRSILQSVEVKQTPAPQAVIALMQETFAKKELA
jgi:hypothetical protein